MRSLPLLLFLTILALHPLRAQTPGELLEAYTAAVRMEKVYVSHDKPYYLPGETVWASVWLVDAGTNRPYAGTPVVYVDWIRPDSTVAQTFTLRIENGNAPLDIKTSPRDTTGRYTLRAYSRYQRNFAPEYIFQKEIRLLGQQLAEDPPPPAGPVATGLRFFPEGGHLVTGLESTVGFKATGPDGEPVATTCTLLDTDGRRLLNFGTLHDGMGMFRLRPAPGATYYVRVPGREEPLVFELPPALPTGIVVKTSSRGDKEHLITLTASENGGLAGATLLGHLGGTPFVEERLTGGRTKTWRIAKSSIPSGLLHLTVFDARRRPVAERLLFNVNPKDSTAVQLTTGSTYGRREAVDLDLRADGADSTYLSLTVHALTEEGANLPTTDIRSYLLLQSELRGRVNNIGQYFRSEDARTATLLDLLLLTHGWRKFDWQDVLAGKRPDLPYAAEQHLSVAGKITRQERDVPLTADVQFSILDPAYFTALEMTTAEDGIFYFTGFDFRDTVDVLLQAGTHNPRRKAKLAAGEMRRTGNRFVDLRLFDLNDYPPDFSASILSRILRPQALKAYAFRTANNLATDTDAAFSVDLAEVTVTTGLNRAQLREKAIKRRYEDQGALYFGGTPKFVADDPQFDDFKKDNIYELISLIVPEIYLVRDAGRPGLKYGSPVNGTTPVIVMDGQILPRSVLDNLDPDNIAVIDILEGMFSLAFSTTGTVIQLIPKAPSERKVSNPGMLSIRMPGFYTARTFYAPSYTGSAAAPEEDYRTTLYWNPRISIGSHSRQLTFFTGDQPGRYRVFAEGLNSDGVAVTKEKVITVR